MTADRGGGRAASWALLGAQAALAVPLGYLLVLTAAAWRAVARGEGRTAIPAVAGHRFAVVVPAHDEATLIASTVRSLRALDYPADRFSVHVVADNCGDATAAVAADAGAEVHERHDPDRPGKGPALEWLVGRLLTGPTPPDAVVFVDADSTLDAAFLRVIDARMAAGARVVQGYYAVRDPGASWAVGLRYAALAVRHYLRPLGRTALGASSGLYGNGMAVAADLLRDRAFSDHLTEDMEFQAELLRSGVLVGFAPDAVVQAEMPTTLAGARTQNERWERGRLSLARRYVPQLLGRGSAAPAVARVDAAMDHLVPPFSVLAAGAAAAGLASQVLRRARPTRLNRVSAALGVALVVAEGAYVLSGLRMVRAPRSVYRALVRSPLLVLWKVEVLVRVLVPSHDVDWVRTARNADREPEATGGRR